MANTKDTKPAAETAVEPDETENTVEPTETEDAPKLGRPSTRKPGGKTLSSYFDKDEYAHITEAGFVKRHKTDSKLVYAAVMAYIADVPMPESDES